MAIKFTKYVNIISGVGGGAGVKTRELILRIFSDNELIDQGSVLEFTTAADVATYFGVNSEEYKRAVFYFSWISPNISAPSRISFARLASAEAGAAVFGGSDAKSLAKFTAVSTGNLRVAIDGVPQAPIAGINLSAAGSLAAVATALQTALQGSPIAALDGALVVYNAIRNRFELRLGDADDAATVTVLPTTAPDVGTLLEWTEATGAVSVSSTVIRTPVEAFNASADVSNNFGTFVMLGVNDLDTIIDVAQANAAENVFFQYLVPVTRNDAAAWSAALIGTRGVGLTLESPVPDEYPELAPAMVLASINWDRPNAVVNPMFRQFALTPSVTSTMESDELDLLRVNYFGVTQIAGQQLAFYQRGLLGGLPNDPVDMNVYGNEQWFKAGIASQILSLFLSLGQVTANKFGRAAVMSVLQVQIDAAVLNGVIAPGKSLTQIQKLYITNQSADDKAWLQVQNLGYWYTGRVASTVSQDGRTEYSIDYTIIYAKADSVRKVNGTHVLI